MASYFREQADQPFGNVGLVSGRTLSPFSRAGLTAAENLLTKAERALSVGDLERASHLIGRAAALDYDHHEETAPAAFAASMMLFTAVADALESSNEGDSRWLEAAVRTLSATTEWGQSELRRILIVIGQDYAVEPEESLRIRDAVVDVPERVELRDVMLPPAELAAAVTSVLRALRTYRTTLNAS
jgi:hypothetical protein